MVLKFRLPPLKLSQSKSIILLACILTFLYLVELCLGVRTVVFVFREFQNCQNSLTTSDDISWTIVVTCLLLCVITSTTISAISSYWASKNTVGVRSSIYYCCHILTGGILWRYVGIFKRDGIVAQREEAMLIANLKFMFTQTYTIPLVILHAYLHNDAYELLYDVLMLVSSSLTLFIACMVFHQYEACGEYPYETMALVPLIFKKEVEKKPETNEKTPSDTSADVPEESKSSWNRVTWRSVVVLQSLCFGFGRIIALSALLKLAGIYALTIIFLQFLVSVLYLKFQEPYLISETLSKSKQLLRLFFLSYTFVFEWQIHRDTATGYNLGTKFKRGISYYSIATVESMFYFIVWSATEEHSSMRLFASGSDYKHGYVIAVSCIGCLLLLISYTIHVGIAVYHQRAGKIEFRSQFVKFLRRLSYPSEKKEDKNAGRVIPTIDISSFSDQDDEAKPKVTNLNNSTNSPSPEAKYGSYRNLKEAINYEIEVKKTSERNVKREVKPKAPIPSKYISLCEQNKNQGNVCSEKGITSKLKDCRKDDNTNHETFLTVIKDVNTSEINGNTTTAMDESRSNITKTKSNVSNEGTVLNKVNTLSSAVSSHFQKMIKFDVKKIFGKREKDLKESSNFTIPTIMTEYPDDKIKAEYLKSVSELPRLEDADDDAKTPPGDYDSPNYKLEYNDSSSENNDSSSEINDSRSENNDSRSENNDSRSEDGDFNSGNKTMQFQRGFSRASVSSNAIPKEHSEDKKDIIDSDRAMLFDASSYVVCNVSEMDIVKHIPTTVKIDYHSDEEDVIYDSTDCPKIPKSPSQNENSRSAVEKCIESEEKEHFV